MTHIVSQLLFSPFPVRLSATGKGFMVVAYNPLGWSREAPLRVPVDSGATCTWHVTGGWASCQLCIRLQLL